MKYLLIALVFVCQAAFGQTEQIAIHKADSITERYADQIFHRAAVVGVYYMGKDTIISHGRINSFGRKADENDVFQIASITKTFTSLMLSKELERGTLTLGESVRPYVDIRKPEKYDSITIKHLATHTSGLPSNSLVVLTPTMAEGVALGFVKNELVLKPLNASKFWLVYPWMSPIVPPLPYFSTYGPGSLKMDLANSNLRRKDNYRYSNVGMGLLGNIIADKHDLSYEELLQQEICEPLGLMATSTQPKHFGSRKYATPHNFFGFKTYRTQWAEGGMEGAGDIKMSAVDMMKYLKLQLEHDHPLSEAAKRQHETYFTANDEKQVGLAMGLGWIKYSRKNLPEIIWHNGQVMGTSAFIGFVPEKNVGIFILSNNARAKKLTRLGFWWLREQIYTNQ